MKRDTITLQKLVSTLILFKQTIFCRHENTSILSLQMYWNENLLTVEIGHHNQRIHFNLERAAITAQSFCIVYSDDSETVTI